MWDLFLAEIICLLAQTDLMLDKRGKFICKLPFLPDFYSVPGQIFQACIKSPGKIKNK